MAGFGAAAQQLKVDIREEGFRLGFSAVGFAPAQLPEAGARFREWLRAGRHGSMDWMAKAPERRSGEEVGGRTRTVVACGLNYYAGGPATAPAGGGVISQYARGEDYHRVLTRKLRALARFAEGRAIASGLLQPAPGAPQQRRVPTLVDHGPLLEKAYAERAGLGWIGKHSNVIAERGSSWFFLGEILFPVALPPDDAHPDRCGSCARCIEACPTSAIVAPYVVDSRRCISYLTIELREAIPREFRRAIGDRIFGCDDCQDVCPWNRFARKATETALAPRAGGLHTKSLAELLRLTQEEFLAATRQSAIRRAGYAGFLRNIAVALGNRGGRRAFRALLGALDHPEPLVRAHVAWALAEVDPEGAVKPLTTRLREETDPGVRVEIRDALDAGPPPTPPKRALAPWAASAGGGPSPDHGEG